MFDDILDIKDKLENAIINHIDNTIKQAALEAKEKSLNPIQTYILIDNKVSETKENIESIFDSYKVFDNIDDQILELMEPYDEAKEKEIEKRVDIILNSKTLRELFDRTEELSKLLYQMECFPDTDYVIKRKNKTLE